MMGKLLHFKLLVPIIIGMEIVSRFFRKFNSCRSVEGS